MFCLTNLTQYHQVIVESYLELILVNRYLKLVSPSQLYKRFLGNVVDPLDERVDEIILSC